MNLLKELMKKIKDNKENLLDVGAGKGDKTLLTRKFLIFHLIILIVWN